MSVSCFMHIFRIHMHMIEQDEVFSELGWSSKLNTEWEFLTHLFEHGRASADKWIKQNFDNIGKKTTAPLEDHFVGDIGASKHVHHYL